MIRVRFEEVGRNKKTWEADLPSRAPIYLEREAKKALLSNDVTCEDGRIYAGFRVVGRYVVLGQQTALAS